MRGEFDGFFGMIKANKEALIVLCFLVKHSGSKEKHSNTSCFPLHFFRTLAASRVLYNKLSTTKASFFKMMSIVYTHSFSKTLQLRDLYQIYIPILFSSEI